MTKPSSRWQNIPRRDNFNTLEKARVVSNPIHSPTKLGLWTTLLTPPQQRQTKNNQQNPWLLVVTLPSVYLIV